MWVPTCKLHLSIIIVEPLIFCDLVFCLPLTPSFALYFSLAGTPRPPIFRASSPPVSVSRGRYNRPIVDFDYCWLGLLHRLHLSVSRLAGLDSPTRIVRARSGCKPLPSHRSTLSHPDEHATRDKEQRKTPASTLRERDIHPHSSLLVPTRVRTTIITVLLWLSLWMTSGSFRRTAPSMDLTARPYQSHRGGVGPLLDGEASLLGLPVLLPGARLTPNLINPTRD